MNCAASRLGRYQSQPTGADQAIQQATGLFGIESLAKRLSADVHQRDHLPPVGGKPPQYPPCIGMFFSKPDLP